MRYKLRRANLVQLERRFATPVHVRTPPGLEIPACVLAYLSRGGKFVADRQPSTVQSVLAEVDSFERSLHKAVSFRGRHFAAHQFQKCRPTTARWNPPAHPDVSRYACMLRDQLSQYQPRARRRNEDFVDVAGRQWLRRHRDQVVVVDADKNLGDVLLPTEWVQETCRQLLAEASTPTSGQQYRQASVSTKCSLDCILTEAVWQGLLPKFVHKFILQSFHISTPGIFRIRVKIPQGTYGSETHHEHVEVMDWSSGILSGCGAEPFDVAGTTHNTIKLGVSKQGRAHDACLRRWLGFVHS